MRLMLDDNRHSVQGIFAQISNLIMLDVSGGAAEITLNENAIYELSSRGGFVFTVGAAGSTVLVAGGQGRVHQGLELTRIRTAPGRATFAAMGIPTVAAVAATVICLVGLG